MKAFQISDSKVLRYLFEKNKAYILWLEEYVTVAEGYRYAHQHFDNIQKAKQIINRLKSEQEDILDALAGE